MNQPSEHLGVKQETIDAFQLMWGNFPAPVMLLKQNRSIVAINKEAKSRGVPTGIKCHQLSGSTGVHEGCLADAALKEGVAKRIVAYSPLQKQVLDSYWVPVAGETDLYVHFGIDITEYAKAELISS
jgi:hypothetical protein